MKACAHMQGLGGLICLSKPVSGLSSLVSAFVYWVFSVLSVLAVPPELSATGNKVVVKAAGVPLIQQDNSGVRVPLGIFPFKAGTGGGVLIGKTDRILSVIADAVLFVRR